MLEYQPARDTSQNWVPIVVTKDYRLVMKLARYVHSRCHCAIRICSSNQQHRLIALWPSA